MNLTLSAKLSFPRTFDNCLYYHIGDMDGAVCDLGQDVELGKKLELDGLQITAAPNAAATPPGELTDMWYVAGYNGVADAQKLAEAMAAGGAVVRGSGGTLRLKATDDLNAPNATSPYGTTPVQAPIASDPGPIPTPTSTRTPQPPGGPDGVPPIPTGAATSRASSGAPGRSQSSASAGASSSAAAAPALSTNADGATEAPSTGAGAVDAAIADEALAKTGSPIARYAGMGLMLLSAGGALVLIMLRRRRTRFVA